MAISEAKKAEIISFSGKMTAKEIADKVGVDRATVFRVLKKNKENRAVAKVVAKSSPSPAHTHAHDMEERSRKTVAIQSQNENATLSPTMIAQVELKRLLSELALYDQALAEQSSDDEKIRSMAEWKLINHDKQMQGHVRIISQWFGMDKGDVLKAIEEIRNDPLAGMTKDQLLALYKVTQ